MTPLFWVGAIWLLIVYGMYQDYRIDRFRQDLFTIRDRLFDLAADGQIQFDHTAYGLVRITINGYIRFAHRVRFWWLVNSYTHYSEDALRSAGFRPFREQFDEALKSLDAGTRKKIEGIMKELHERTLNHIFLMSVPLIVLSALTALLAAIFVGVKSATRAISRRTVAALDSTAAIEGGEAVLA